MALRKCYRLTGTLLCRRASFGKNGSITRPTPDLERNGYIKNAVLFEESSILPLSECLESSGW